MSLVIPAPEAPTLPILNDAARFPVGRIFCIGRNYAEHAREMKAPAEPIFFMKPADSVCTEPRLPFPDKTGDLHHEVEMVLALGEGGKIWGAGVGVDLTRRDLQQEMKAKSAPWEIAKSFEASAPVGALLHGYPPASATVSLSVNGDMRQTGDLRDMILKPDDILAALSRYFTPRAGDLIFTGTPAGVGRLEKGDHVHARVQGLPDLDFELV